MKGLRLILLLVMTLTACGSNTDLSGEAIRGEALVQELGCQVCHGAADGIGPSWSGTWGTLRRLVDGSSVEFDAAYVRASIAEPGSQVVSGFDPVMPSFSLNEADLQAVSAYLKELK
ncbi:MAG: cytochrome c [Acidimicrobiia bacterium]|nr:cytochrome c [Acidimicrobiia bacterium]